MSEIELFSYEACPFAQRTRIMLIEKHARFTLTEVNLKNKPEWWKKLSPTGKVPLIRHKNNIIYESRIINEYLEEILPNPRLMPVEPYKRAKARIWIDFCDTTLLPTFHQLIKDQNNPERQDDNRQKIKDKMLLLENEALGSNGEGPFFMGKNISLVDIQYIPFFERFPCYEEIWGAKIPQECSKLNLWIDKMHERESFKKTAKPKEFHMERYKNYS